MLELKLIDMLENVRRKDASNRTMLELKSEKQEYAAVQK